MFFRRNNGTNEQINMFAFTITLKRSLCYWKIRIILLLLLFESFINNKKLNMDERKHHKFHYFFY